MRPVSNKRIYQAGLITTVCVVLGSISVLFIRRAVVSDIPSPDSVSTPEEVSPAPRFIPTRLPISPDGGTGSTPSVASGGAGSTPPALSPAVLAITGEQHQAVDYNHFRDALRALTRDLSPDDVAALKRFLERKAANQSMMRPIAFNGIKNDVLDVLLLQDNLPDGIDKLLVKMYRDKSNDDMWRDYCVQFMSAYYEVKWPVGAVEKARGKQAARAEKERETIENALRDALKETGTAIAGTALLGLDSLSRRYDNIAREDVGRAAMDLLGNPTAGEPARITAFAVAASHQLTEALPEARIIAQTGESIPLQMAAIALIGQVGEAEDLELLAALVWQEDPRIKRLATTALESLRKRKV